MSQRPSRFTVAAWLFFAYLIAVILFGAWVRISHSGAGCGSNWPTCGGEVIPTAPSTATLIEFVHRVSSGFCGIFGLAILVWSWVRFGFGAVTRAAALTLVFIVFEGAIGAGLVLGELVADDDSVARAVVIALHLGNTLALTAFSALTAWCSGSRDAPRFL
ncbi:MAG: COX15/CtaA family protein, partial [Bryobacterales bacterium]|nr:COX15/CtaA family protein [Bryobacterales bacterium]